MASIEAPAPSPAAAAKSTVGQGHRLRTRPRPRPRTRPRESGPRRGRTGTTVANVVGVVFTIVMAFPAYWMINTAFKPPTEVLTFTPHFFPEHPTFDNFVSAVKADLFLNVLRNSLIITASSVPPRWWSASSVRSPWPASGSTAAAP